MKKLLFLLLLIPSLGFGQSDESIAAFLKSRPDSLGQPVLLPGDQHLDPYDLNISYKQRQLVYVVSSDSVYHKLFPQFRHTKDSLKNYMVDNDSFFYKLYLRYLVDSLPVFDFSRQELVLYAACGQCLAFCNHPEENHCHRNACTFMNAWYVRDRDPLFVKNKK